MAKTNIRLESALGSQLLTRELLPLQFKEFQREALCPFDISQSNKYRTITPDSPTTVGTFDLRSKRDRMITTTLRQMHHSHDRLECSSPQCFRKRAENTTVHKGSRTR